MASFQSTLGEEEGIAEELAKGQRQISIAEFFEKNKHMLGFDSGARGLVTAVKEGVDNSLDAAEEAGVLPDVYVEIAESGDYYRVVIEDNGPGITRGEVPKVFGKLLYGSRFHKREQNRGQQGIGISAAVLYSQLTSGRPARITSRPKGHDSAHYAELIIDTDTNEPEIKESGAVTWDRPHGTRIELEMEANMRARSQLHDYIKHTAVVNPHARIELREPGLDEPLKFERATDRLPDETHEIRPHPHGVELGTLIKMLEATESYSLSGFLQEEFTRVGRKTADGILDAFRDRHYGREFSWPVPDDGADVAAAIEDAVANKGAEATAAFADGVVDALADRDRVARFELAAVVDDVAGRVADETGRTFGSTVRENAVAAAWAVVAAAPAVGEADGDESESRSASVGAAGDGGDALDRLTPDLRGLVDDATSSRKDDATVDALAEALARRLADRGDRDRYRLARAELDGLVDDAAEFVVDRHDATVGDTARGNVADAVWAATRTVPDDPPKVRDLADDRDAASDLLESMRTADILAPPTDCLAPITAELVEAGLRKEFDADFYAAATRDADVHGGDPFIVEAGIAYGGELEDGTVDLLRFANRVPLVYQRGACATTDVIRSIGWRNYGLDQPGGSGMPNGPAVITIHVASTNVPFTSESKDAIANVPEIESEIELAVREAARELKSYLNRRRSLEKRREKRDVLGRILPVMARKVAQVTDREPPNVDVALARIMNNVGVHREAADGEVELTVRNHSDRAEELELTEIVSADAEPEPIAANGDGGTAEPDVVSVDGDWFVRWSAAVPSGGTARLRYRAPDDADFELDVDGVEPEKLTLNA